jgi:hypothetical protein
MSERKNYVVGCDCCIWQRKQWIDIFGGIGWADMTFDKNEKKKYE